MSKHNQKASGARVLSVRLNRNMDEREALALDIVEDLESKDFTLRQIITDAILRADGHTPEMFSKEEKLTPHFMRELFEDFTTYIISQIRAGEFKLAENSEHGDDDTEVTQQLVNAFQNRNRRK